MIDLAALVLTCAPLVAQDTARALIQVESGGNPFAIGVVGGALVRQPANLPEALATVAALEAAGSSTAAPSAASSMSPSRDGRGRAPGGPHRVTR